MAKIQEFLDAYTLFVSPDEPDMPYAVRNDNYTKDGINYYNYNPVYVNKEYNSSTDTLADYKLYTAYRRRKHANGNNFISFNTDFKTCKNLLLRAQFTKLQILFKMEKQFSKVTETNNYKKFLAYYAKGNIVPRAKRSDSYSYSLCKVERVDAVVPDQHYKVYLSAFSNEAMKPVKGRSMCYELYIVDNVARTTLLQPSHIDHFISWQLQDLKKSIITTYQLFRQLSKKHNSVKKDESKNLPE